MFYFCASKVCYKTAVGKSGKKEFDISASLAEVWRVLTEQEREVLKANSTIQHFKRNEMIYCEGDEAKDMMCVLKGKVKISKQGVGGRSHYSGNQADPVFCLPCLFCTGAVPDQCFGVRSFDRMYHSNDRCRVTHSRQFQAGHVFYSSTFD